MYAVKYLIVEPTYSRPAALSLTAFLPYVWWGSRPKAAPSGRVLTDYQTINLNTQVN